MKTLTPTRKDIAKILCSRSGSTSVQVCNVVHNVTFTGKIYVRKHVCKCFIGN